MKNFYEKAMPDQNLTRKGYMKIMAKKPVELIQNWIQRLNDHVSDLQAEK